MSAPIPDPVRRRVGQLIRLLSSDQLGEVAAAAQALTRTLASAGLDIHALAEVAEAGLPEARKSTTGKRCPPVTASWPEPPLKMGETLICDAPSGVFRACSCGGDLRTVEPGVGPHFAKLVCTSCEGTGRWLSRKYFEVAS